LPYWAQENRILLYFFNSRRGSPKCRSFDSRLNCLPRPRAGTTDLEGALRMTDLFLLGGEKARLEAGLLCLWEKNEKQTQGPSPAYAGLRMTTGERKSPACAGLFVCVGEK
jgi:hypothetical protein